LKEKTEIVNSKRSTFEYIPKSLEMKGNLDHKLLNYKEKEIEEKYKYKPYRTTDNWSVEENEENGNYLMPQRFNNYCGRTEEKKYNKDIIYRKRKILKKKKKKRFNNGGYSDNDTDVHSNFLVGKAVAMAISFGMIKDVKTMDVASDLTNVDRYKKNS
jgi:hypothetical protein